MHPPSWHTQNVNICIIGKKLKPEHNKYTVKMSDFDRIVIFDVITKIFISTVWAQFWGY